MPANIDAIVAAAKTEWERWGNCTQNLINGQKSSGFHSDDEADYAQYVIDTYCALFRDTTKPITWPTQIAISNDQYPWSAVTISYIMQKAGFTREEFPISESHSTYIRWAVAAKKSTKKVAYWGYRIDDVRALPDVGDLVGHARSPKRLSDAAILAFYDKTSSYTSHSDIVVAKRASEIDVIGGNVRDSVCKKTMALNAAGQLVDKNHAWFVVLKKR